MDIIDLSRTPAASQRAGALLRTAINAAAAGDSGRALTNVAELIRMAPAHAGTFLNERGVDNVKPALAALIDQFTAAAGLSASDRLDAAAALVRRDHDRKPPGWDVSASTLRHHRKALR